MDHDDPTSPRGAGQRVSGKRVFAGAVLLLLGKFGLVISLCYGSLYLILQTTLLPARILSGVAISSVFLVSSALLLRDFQWLKRLPMHVIAYTSLLLSSALLRIFLMRQPRHLATPEATALAVSIPAFCITVFLLRRKKRPGNMNS